MRRRHPRVDDLERELDASAADDGESRGRCEWFTERAEDRFHDK